VLPRSPCGLPSIATMFMGDYGTTLPTSSPVCVHLVKNTVHRHNQRQSQYWEVEDVSKQVTGIIALVLGIVVLIWPSWSYIILGVLLILIGVALLMGKMKSLF